MTFKLSKFLCLYNSIPRNSSVRMYQSGPILVPRRMERLRDLLLGERTEKTKDLGGRKESNTGENENETRFSRYSMETLG